jgi:hypothetical protein
VITEVPAEERLPQLHANSHRRAIRLGIKNKARLTQQHTHLRPECIHRQVPDVQRAIE